MGPELTTFLGYSDNCVCFVWRAASAGRCAHLSHSHRLPSNQASLAYRVASKTISGLQNLTHTQASERANPRCVLACSVCQGLHIKRRHTTSHRHGDGSSAPPCMYVCLGRFVTSASARDLPRKTPPYRDILADRVPSAGLDQSPCAGKCHCRAN